MDAYLMIMHEVEKERLARKAREMNRPEKPFSSLGSAVHQG
jgi:hypothetical protein